MQSGNQHPQDPAAQYAQPGPGAPAPATGYAPPADAQQPGQPGAVPPGMTPVQPPASMPMTPPAGTPVAPGTPAAMQP
ncbi:MAG: hypothetical protein KDC46_13415, partial [Thermoleophilia bacterium]|nr:hypothetical protein [Thermoleophilia bacterium]